LLIFDFLLWVESHPAKQFSISANQEISHQKILLSAGLRGKVTAPEGALENQIYGMPEGIP
jgi:hypothetical protein